MALRVGDVKDLRAGLVASGAAVDLPMAEVIRDLGSWYESDGKKLGILNRQAFAYLSECLRSARDDEARHLATGAFMTLREGAAADPERSRFVTHYAIRQLSQLTGRTYQWGGIPILPEEESTALGLFDDSLSETDHEDDELLRIASEFIERHSSGSDLFGRFAHDLETLLEILTDSEQTKRAHEIARAALIYFVEVDDAIPDDLGPVGLLDDAFVARRAVEELRPGRSVLAGYLDRVTSKWPFLVDVVFSAEDHEYRLSEFMVLNAAMLLETIEAEEGDATGTAIVTGEAGPLPFLVGFVRALAEVRNYAEARSTPTFETGARVSIIGQRGRVVVRVARLIQRRVRRPGGRRAPLHHGLSRRMFAAEGRGTHAHCDAVV